MFALLDQDVNHAAHVPSGLHEKSQIDVLKVPGRLGLEPLRRLRRLAQTGRKGHRLTACDLGLNERSRILHRSVDDDRRLDGAGRVMEEINERANHHERKQQGDRHRRAGHEGPLVIGFRADHA